MKIGLLSKPWLPVPSRAYGAIEKCLYYLAVELARDDGIEVTLFAPGDSRLPRDSSAKLNYLFKSGVGGVIDESGVEIAQAMHGALEAEAQGLDIVHVHSVDSFLALTPFLKIPTVFTFYTFPNETNKLLSQMAKNTTFTFLANSHRRDFPWLKEAVSVPPGLDLRKFPFYSKKQDYLAFVGSVLDEKGIIEAIEIAEKAKMTLKIAAKVHSKDQKFYEREFLPRLRSSKHTKFLGEVTEKERNALLGNAKALLFPIKWNEPFGLVQIESLAVGTPVIAFNNGAVPEVVGHGRTGFIVKNVQEAVDAVKRLDSIDPGDCRRSVKKRFSAKIAAQKYLELYNEVLKKI